MIQCTKAQKDITNNAMQVVLSSENLTHKVSNIYARITQHLGSC